MRIFFPICLLALVTVQADYELRQYDSKKQSSGQMQGKTSSASLNGQKVLATKVTAVIIAPEGDKPGDYVLKTSRGTQIYRTMQGIPNKQKMELQKKIDKLVIGQALTVEKAAQIKRIVAQCYQDNNQALVVVSVNEKDIKDGVVTVSVLESRTANVTVTGNKWFSNEWYLSRLSTEEGQTIPTQTLDNEVAAINNSPWRKASLIYKPGETYGTTDVELVVQDERPLKLFVGADNTGFEITNYNRLFIGINWGNIANYEQSIAYQYTASPDFKKFQGQTLYYTVALPNYDEISVFGVYSSINVNKSHLLLTTNNKGHEWQGSARYEIFVPPSGNFYQKGKAGFDFKNTNNDLTVTDIGIVSSSNATIFQLMGAYEAQFTSGPHRLQFDGDVYCQPWHFGKTMSKSNYDQLRPDAVNTFIYMKAKAHYHWLEPKGRFGVTAKGRVQFSSGALLPLEMMGIGGVNTVRGYVERVVNVDNGMVLNLEVHSMSVSPSYGKINDKLSGLVFFDMGAGGIFHPTQGQPRSYFLAGIGPALRYDISTWLKTRFDLGFRLTAPPFQSSSNSLVQFNFSAIASY